MSVETDPNHIKETFQGYRFRSVTIIFYLVVSLIMINMPNMQHESAFE
jgi:hypothetical protein